MTGRPAVTDAWRCGDVGGALAHALAIRDHPGDDLRSRTLKQGALICFATYARNLGKYRLARQIVEDLLVQPLPRTALTDTLVLAASIWLGLGSPEAALALVERAAKRMDPGDPLRVAYVEHQWAKLLLRSGEPEEAARHLDRAIALYEEVGDRYNELRALDLRTQVLEALQRALAGDHAQTHIASVSTLGLVEMTRKRTRDSLEHLLCAPCPSCEGRGFVRTPESVCHEIFREIVRQSRQFQTRELLILAHQSVIDRLLDDESAVLAELEHQVGRPIKLQVEALYGFDQYDVVLT